MVNIRNFGDVLLTLRKERKWTQAEACAGICELRTYKRWEKNKKVPSFYYISHLSNHFNYDLLTCYKLLAGHNSCNYLLLKEKAEWALLEKNWDTLKAVINEIELITEPSNSEYYEALLYYKAVYEFATTNYLSSIQFCINALQYEDPQITDDFPLGKIFTPTGFYLTHCLAMNYSKLKNHDKSIFLYQGLLTLIEEKLLPEIPYYQSLEQEKQLHQITSLHLCKEYLIFNQLEEGLACIIHAVQFSVKQNYYGVLLKLMKQKLEILCMLDRLDEAREVFWSCNSLFLLNKDLDGMETLNGWLENEYPILFFSDKLI